MGVIFIFFDLTKLWTIILLIIFSAFVIYLVREDYMNEDQLQVITVILVWLDYIIVILLVGYGVWQQIWSFHFFTIISLILGTILILTGVLLIMLSLYEFRTIERMSDLDQSKLITSGIYGCSRNPQNVGLILVLFGISIAGTSIYSIVISSVFLIVFASYVPIEERHLITIFGENYVQYRHDTSRYLDIKCVAKFILQLVQVMK